jgi:hypothetical protein
MLDPVATLELAEQVTAAASRHGFEAALIGEATSRNLAVGRKHSSIISA